MNEHQESGEVPPIIPAEGPAPIQGPELLRPEPKPFSYWVKRFFACNPFYLVSAALLLFGLYRLADDSMFPGKETLQLAFNFTSLQFYEVLLVATAIFLARRRIWYDSTLLTGLENLLVFVPFILVSQAALIGRQAAVLMCLAGAVIALVRFAGLKRFFAELNLPTRVLGMGAVLLVLNVALPVVYRVLHESKYETKPVWGAAYWTNECAWLLMLPAALTLANFLPRALETGSLLPQRRWLPAGLFALWFVATGVHLYCLGYVYDFDLRRELLAPGLWVLAWTAWRRLAEFFTMPEYAWKTGLLFPPVAAALLAAGQHGNKVFLALIALNVVIYATLCFLDRGNRFVRHLLFTSVVLLIAGVPAEWVRWLTPDFDRTKYLVAGVAVYGFLCAALSRNPIVGFAGAGAVALMIEVLFANNYKGPYQGTIHWALQAGLVFLLVHSLGWDDAKHKDARAARRFVAMLWLGHAFLWLQFGGKPWMTCVTGAAFLLPYLAIQFYRGRWGQYFLPATAILVILSGPGNVLVGTLRSTPLGLLAVIGSFVLFALGTVAALTKHRWHQPEES